MIPWPHTQPASSGNCPPPRPPASSPTAKSAVSSSPTPAWSASRRWTTEFPPTSPSPPTLRASRQPTPTVASPLATHLPSPASPCRSRTCSAPTGLPPPAPRECSPSTSQCTMPPPWRGSASRARCCWVRATWTSLAWGPPPRTPPSSQRATPGTPHASPAAAAGARRPRWRPARRPLPWAPTPEAASASRPPSAESPA